MSQYDFKITDFERIFRKGYRIIIATVITAVVFAVVLVKMKPLNYRSSATVKYDNKSVLSSLGSEAAMMAYDYLDNMTTIANDVTSYPVLVRAAQKLGLIDASASDDIRHSSDSIHQIIQPLAAQITTETNASAYTITVNTISTDPVQARDLANAVAYAFKEFSYERKKIQVLKTKKFVTSQLDRIQQELFDVESEMIAFEEKQRLPSMGASTTRIISQSDRLDDELETIANQLEVIERQRKQLSSRKATPYDSTRGHRRQFIWLSEFIDDDPGLTQLNNRLLTQQIERDNQLAYYKNDHPVIIALNNSISATADRLVKELDKKATALTSRRNMLLRQQDQLSSEIREIPRNEINLMRLKRRHKVKEEIFTMFSKRLQEINIAEASIIDDMAIIALAKIANQPINDALIQAVGIALFIGLVIGILIVILQELFDTSIGTIEDVEVSMKLPVIAVIPQLHHAKKRFSFSLKKGLRHSTDASSLVTHFNPKEFSAEAFRILRTNIDFFCHERNYQTFLFSSSSMNEGKSTILANLSIAFAQQGKKCLLLEANLRRPSLDQMFGVQSEIGLSDILIEKNPWEKCVMSVTDLALGNMHLNDILSTPGLQNFFFIPQGNAQTNPTELLSSGRMNQLLATLKEEFDIIFIDTPPILPVADGIVLSKKVDGVILVYKVGAVPKKAFQLCKERLDAVEANILGVVLNGLRPETAGSSYSKYSMKAYNVHKA